MSDDPARICDALRRYRIENRINQQTMARALGVTQGQVSRWESGRDLPRARNVAAIKALLWGQQISPLTSLACFVAVSSLPLALFDHEHRLVAVGQPFQRPDSPLDRHGWVLDPRRNPGFVAVYQEYRGILDDPRGVVALEVTVPFEVEGRPWRAEARKTVCAVDGRGTCLAEIVFAPVAGDEAADAPRLVRIGIERAPAVPRPTAPPILSH